jgi:Ca2+-binding EF-hand superfamily protein
MLLMLALALSAQQDPPAPPVRPADTLRPPTSTIIVEPVAMMIAAFDGDGDGRVTRAEFDAGVRHSFEVIDKGHKGSLSYIDFGDWAQLWLGDRNAIPSPFETDRDGDNRITLAELQERFDSLFTRFDRDKDGVITRAELLTIRGADFMGPERGKGRHKGRGQ